MTLDPFSPAFSYIIQPQKLIQRLTNRKNKHKNTKSKHDFRPFSRNRTIDFLLIGFYKIFDVLSTFFYYETASRSKRYHAVGSLLHALYKITVYQHYRAVYPGYFDHLTSSKGQIRRSCIRPDLNVMPTRGIISDISDFGGILFTQKNYVNEQKRHGAYPPCLLKSTLYHFMIKLSYGSVYKEVSVVDSQVLVFVVYLQNLVVLPT